MSDSNVTVKKGIEHIDDYFFQYSLQFVSFNTVLF